MSDVQMVLAGRMAAVTRKVTKKDGGENVFYQLKLDYMGGSLWLNCDESEGIQLKQGGSYKCMVSGYFREFDCIEWDRNKGVEARRKKTLFAVTRLLDAKEVSAKDLLSIEDGSSRKAGKAS